MIENNNPENFSLLLKSIKKISNIITLKREYILKEIFYAQKPLSTKEIQLLVKQHSNTDISLPTLYTSLQIFEEYHILDSLQIAAKKSKLYFIRGEKSQNFLICTNCGTIIKFNDKTMNEQIIKISQNKDYILLNQKALLYGICEECNK